MLPPTSLKEQLSRAYIRVVSARAGCIVRDAIPDHGVDQWLVYLTSTPGGGHRELGHQVGIQAKATTRAEISGKNVRYDLDVTAYRDLTIPSGLPRILVLYVLPRDEQAWLEMSEDELVLRQCAYWEHLRGHPATENDSTVRISIPRSRRFDMEALAGPLRRLALTRRLP